MTAWMSGLLIIPLVVSNYIAGQEIPC